MTNILETEPLPSTEPVTPKLAGRVAFVTGGTVVSAPRSRAASPIRAPR